MSPGETGEYTRTPFLGEPALPQLLSSWLLFPLFQVPSHRPGQVVAEGASRIHRNRLPSGLCIRNLDRCRNLDVWQQGGPTRIAARF